MAATKTKFGVVKTILLITILIVIVQIITVSFITSQDNFEERARRDHTKIHETDFIYDETYLPNALTKENIDNNYSNKNDHINLMTMTTEPVRCDVKHKDAKSALSRVKSEQCKNELYQTICAAQEKTLFWKNITRMCQVPAGKRPAHSIQSKMGYGPPIRILYAMVVHGRAFRQVKRLFKALYHKNHYFYIHVDSRSDYLYEELKTFVKRFDNVAVAPWRMATIWGGASLLQMLLRMMADVLRMADWKWDFFLNISAADYPVQHNEKLSAFLRSHRDENFLKPHGGKTERFVKKQGLSRIFYECDEHMWRLGDRDLPSNIDFDGGSDWICLNRKFVDYLVHSDDTLVNGMKHMYRYALLPAESFFHVVLRNSRYCTSFAKGNMRLANWKRKLGCRCQYKHIVDWCGCSPNDFKPEDLVRLQSQTINHFARKFEPIVNQEIINLLDEWLFGKPETPLIARNVYWENVYHSRHDNGSKFDMILTALQSFSRIASKEQTVNDCEFFPIWRPEQATLYMSNDTFHGVLSQQEYKVIAGRTLRETISVETFFQPIRFLEMRNRNMSEPANRLQSLAVGTSWDQKERIFRNIAGIIGPRDEPVLVHRWVHGPEFHVRIVWQDPLNVIAGMYQMKVDKTWVISFHKPKFNKPLRPGTWTVKIVFNDDITLGLTKFLVIPQSYYDGKEGVLNDVIATNNGPPAGLYASDYVVEFDREANDTSERVVEFAKNSKSIGSSLEGWIDSIMQQHWKFVGICVSSERTGVKNKCIAQLPSCSDTDWSSKSPDPKSEVKRIEPNGYLS
ncbi:xylosyltransferase 2-like [Clytia hemisphaerica]|uniref:protein xylosyltransferase n=2 Tax=Clytia hemisphaerica TaxID=252671 RepID=A0A7M5XKB9_9CNID